MIIVRHRFGVLLTHRVCCLRIQWMMLAIGACLATSAFAGLQQVMMYWGRHNECPSLVEMRSLHESASMFIGTSTKDAMPEKFWREKCHMHKFECFRIDSHSARLNWGRKGEETRIRRKKFNLFSLFLQCFYFWTPNNRDYTPAK